MTKAPKSGKRVSEALRTIRGTCESLTGLEIRNIEVNFKRMTIKLTPEPIFLFAEGFEPVTQEEIYQARDKVAISRA